MDEVEREMYQCYDYEGPPLCYNCGQPCSGKSVRPLILGNHEQLVDFPICDDWEQCEENQGNGG